MHHRLKLNSLLPTFVPAGFVDVGHSVVRDASTGKNVVIVDSVQSIANHLEAELVTAPGQVVAGLETLPFVRLTVTDPHGLVKVTSSLELPHRLASGWFCKTKELMGFQDQLAQRILHDGIAKATFHYCPNALLHGVFYSQLAGLDPNIAKSPRLITAEVVALGAQSISDGGVAKDPLFPSGGGFDVESLVGKKATAAEVGAGYIPYRHQAFTAETVELSIYLSENRIGKMDLPDPAKQVLRLLARLKIALFLAKPIDLRSHCVFQVETSTIPEDLQDSGRIFSELQASLEECKSAGLLADPAVTEFALVVKAAPAAKGKVSAGAGAVVVDEDG